MNRPGKPNIATDEMVYMFNGMNNFKLSMIMLNPYNMAKANIVLFIIFKILFIKLIFKELKKKLKYVNFVILTNFTIRHERLLTLKILLFIITGIGDDVFGRV